jgi:hypothetical protein
MKAAGTEPRPAHRWPGPSRPSPARAQRGLTLFGLLFWALFVGFFGYLAIRVFPTLNEYFTIHRIVDKIASGNPATVAEARAQFERQKDVEYSISAIGGKDLDITKENDQVVIRFAYNKEVPIYGNVFVLIKYEGQSRPAQTR